MESFVWNELAYLFSSAVIHAAFGNILEFNGGIMIYRRPIHSLNENLRTIHGFVYSALIVATLCLTVICGRTFIKYGKLMNVLVF